MIQALTLRDNFSLYLEEISRYPLLSESEERELALSWYQFKNLEAAQKLVMSNLRFVVKIAYQFKNYKIKLEDLVQEGNLGLMEAVKRFDPNQNVRLVNYASWWIKSRIQAYILKMWNMVKIGTTQAQRKLFFKLRQTQERILLQHSNHVDIIREVAKELKVKEDEVETMMIRLQKREYSLDRSVSDENSTTFEDIIPISKNVEDEFIERESESRQQEILSASMDVLNDRERDIISQRFSSTPLTYQEIGDIYGISKQRVQQIEQNAISKMRKFFEKEGEID
ncbi:RNA polymerase factor sigma-32 [bacterium]|nr:RNA polymerase factor sigma-32 [bacterium]